MRIFGFVVNKQVYGLFGTVLTLPTSTLYNRPEIESSAMSTCFPPRYGLMLQMIARKMPDPTRRHPRSPYQAAAVKLAEQLRISSSGITIPWSVTAISISLSTVLALTSTQVLLQNRRWHFEQVIRAAYLSTVGINFR